MISKKVLYLIIIIEIILYFNKSNDCKYEESEPSILKDLYKQQYKTLDDKLNDYYHTVNILIDKLNDHILNKENNITIRLNDNQHAYYNQYGFIDYLKEFVDKI